MTMTQEEEWTESGRGHHGQKGSADRQGHLERWKPRRGEGQTSAVGGGDWAGSGAKDERTRGRKGSKDSTLGKRVPRKGQWLQ